jgi:hypothetical protein
VSPFGQARKIRAQLQAAGINRPTLGDALASRKNPEWDSRQSQASVATEPPPPPQPTEPGRGTIIACYNTDLYKGDDTLFACCLFVVPDGGLPYPTTCESGVPDAHLERCVPGTTVPVRYVQGNAAIVDIDWAAVGS